MYFYNGNLHYLKYILNKCAKYIQLLQLLLSKYNVNPNGINCSTSINCQHLE